MATNERPAPRTFLFNATHLNITNDPTNQPPPASLNLLAARQHTKAAWEAFEVAENALVRTDEEVHNEVMNYSSTVLRRIATLPEYEEQKVRFTPRIHEPRVAEVEACCRVLETSAQAPEVAANMEPETVEARATMKVDLVVIRSCLETTREILRTVQIQLERARRALDPS